MGRAELSGRLSRLRSTSALAIVNGRADLVHHESHVVKTRKAGSVNDRYWPKKEPKNLTIDSILYFPRRKGSPVTIFSSPDVSLNLMPDLATVRTNPSTSLVVV
jgi:hypothetical protein